MSIVSRVRVPVLAASVALLAIGCSDSTGPGASIPAQFTQEITYEEFQQTVTQGEPVRVEVKVRSAARGIALRGARARDQEAGGSGRP